MEALARLIYGVTGWTVVGEIPDRKKLVIVIAYHTSNWDFVYYICAKFIKRVQVYWFGKHTIFKKPFAAMFRRWGGIPLRRHLHEKAVEMAVAESQSREYFAIGMAPEGTRSHVTQWKTGFYYIARGAGADILPAAIDYKNRQVVIGDCISLTGNELVDFKKIYQFFRHYEPRYPALACHGDEHLAKLEAAK
jgi:1-acyl-sn-glycerol-3-phosphate acyltransferase